MKTRAIVTTLWLALAAPAVAAEAGVATPAQRAAALEARAARLEADVVRLCAARPPQARAHCGAELERSAARLRGQAARLR